MKYNFRFSCRCRRFLLLAALANMYAGQAFAAGVAASTSTYMTIQPNLAGTHYVITLSWVAPDTDADSNGLTEAKASVFGNGSSALDNPYNLHGGDISTAASQKIFYRWQAATVSSGSHVRYDTVPANTTTNVQWTSSGDYNVGTRNPTTATPQWVNLGAWPVENWATNVHSYGSDGGGTSTGVTGVFSTNPSGTGAATGNGVGVYYDFVSTAQGGIGFMLAGYDDLQDPTPANPYPNTGYIRVEIPNPTEKWNNPGAGDFTVVPHAFSLTDKFNLGTFTSNGAVELVVTNNASYTPKKAVSGDFDSDLDVEADDLADAAAGYGGAGVGTKWYRNGNIDADTDTDNKDLGYVIGTFTPSSSSGSASLTYDPVTGNVKLNAATAAGAKITSFQLQTSAATIVPGGYAGPTFGGTYQNVTTSVIGNTDTTLAGATGLIDLGNVFPTGMDLTQLTSYLTTKVYTGEAGSGQQQLTLALAAGGNTDPTISDIANQTIPSGGNTGALAITVGDAETAVGSLSLSVSANSNSTLVPNGNIVFGGSDASRTVTVTPVSGLSGTATITIRVTDGGSLFAEDTFTVTVTDNYLSWATASGVTGGPEGDSDNDGVKNLVEYALVDGGERGTLSGNTITFTKRGGVYGGDLAYDIESSTSLSGWSVLDKPPVIESASEIKYTFTPGTPSQDFFRLKVVVTP